MKRIFRTGARLLSGGLIVLALALAPAAPAGERWTRHEALAAPRRVGPVAASRSDDATPAAVLPLVEPRFMMRPAAGLMTGWFGERRYSHTHAGMDIDGDTGDGVWAPGPGLVVHAGPAPAGYGGFGTMVEIDHGGGVHTVYAHLSALAVMAGQRVRMGAPLGAIGTTGSVTGSHLHFEVRVDGIAVNPALWLPPQSSAADDVLLKAAHPS